MYIAKSNRWVNTWHDFSEKRLQFSKQPQSHYGASSQPSHGLVWPIWAWPGSRPRWERWMLSVDIDAIPFGASFDDRNFNSNLHVARCSITSMQTRFLLAAGCASLTSREHLWQVTESDVITSGMNIQWVSATEDDASPEHWMIGWASILIIFNTARSKSFLFSEHSFSTSVTYDVPFSCLFKFDDSHPNLTPVYGRRALNIRHWQSIRRTCATCLPFFDC